jgi:molybdate transport repressor ModE-like protein
MHNLEDLNDLRLVSIIAETGSLSGAAKHLGLNHATVFRHLNEFEERIGVRLFERSNGRYHVTPAGDALAHAGTAINDAATQALLKVAGGDLRPSGNVRLSTTDSIALSLLHPILARCRSRYPDITLTVEVANRDVNLSRRDADIAIRPTNTPPDHLIGKLLGPVQFCIYGSTSYLAKAGDKPLAEHDWIGLDDSFSGHRTLRWLEKIKPLVEVGYRSNTFGCIRQACRDDMGLALLPCVLGDSAGDLERVGAPLPECSTELWLLTHPDLRDATRVKVVFQLLHEMLSAKLT